MNRSLLPETRDEISNQGSTGLLSNGVAKKSTRSAVKFLFCDLHLRPNCSRFVRRYTAATCATNLIIHVTWNGNNIKQSRWNSGEISNENALLYALIVPSSIQRTLYHETIIIEGTSPCRSASNRKQSEQLSFSRILEAFQ